MCKSLAELYVHNLRKSGYTGNITTFAPISDTHGGHSALHKKEIETIASQIVDQKLDMLLPELTAVAQSAAYQQFCNDLTFDISETVNIALDDATNIFSDRKTKKIVADRLTKNIMKQLGAKNHKISL